MKRLVISTLGFIILIIIGVTASGQVIARPLPRLIQNLSDEDYAIWVQWQNRQTERRTEEIVDRTRWTRYNYADRVISNSFSRGSATTRTSSSSNSLSNSSAQSGKGWSNRSNSRSATRSGYANSNFSRLGGTTITSYQTRFINPDYVGPGSAVIYNPWVRSRGELSEPDWENLFVPCEEGTTTMQEVLDRLIGPQNPEKVFEIMLEGHFSG